MQNTKQQKIKRGENTNMKITPNENFPICGMEEKGSLLYVYPMNLLFMHYPSPILS